MRVGETLPGDSYLRREEGEGALALQKRKSRVRALPHRYPRKVSLSHVCGDLVSYLSSGEPGVKNLPNPIIELHW